MGREGAEAEEVEASACHANVDVAAVKAASSLENREKRGGEGAGKSRS